MSRNSVSRVRLRTGTRWRGSRLPPARPYRARSLGPKISAGACRRPFHCSSQPESDGASAGRTGPRTPENGPKSPKMRPGSPPIACKRVPPPCYTSGCHRGTTGGLFGGRVAPQPLFVARLCPFVVCPLGLCPRARVGQTGRKPDDSGVFQNWYPALGEGQTDLRGAIRGPF